MILPLSDAPNPRGVPFVTYTLIAINVAVYLFLTLPLSRHGVDLADPSLQNYVQTIRDALPRSVSIQALLRQTSAYDLFVFHHGFRPGSPEWIDLLTSLFLHGGFLHLFGNMLFLWIYGDNVEHRLGSFWFLFCYVFTGVAATLFFSLFARGSNVPLVGASGAISGVLGFYFLWFPHNTVRLFVFFFPIITNVVEVGARLVLGFYLVIDNLLPFVFGGTSGSGVAHGAHIGGFLAGLAMAAWTDRRERNAPPSEYRGRTATPPPHPGEVIGGAIERGDFEEAARVYFALPAEATRRILGPEHSLALGEWFAANGHATAALSVYRRHLRDYPNGPGVAEAHLGAGLLQLESFRQVAAAYQHILDALASNPSTETEERARAALRVITSGQKYRIHRFEGGL